MDNFTKKLSDGCSIINIQDIKNTINTVKMKIVFIEVTPLQNDSMNNNVNKHHNNSNDTNVSNDTNDTNDTKDTKDTKDKRLHNIKKKHNYKDDLDSGIFNLNDSKEVIELTPETTKVIRIGSFIPPSKNDDFIQLGGENGEGDGEGENGEGDNTSNPIDNINDVEENGALQNGNGDRSAGFSKKFIIKKI